MKQGTIWLSLLGLAAALTLFQVITADFWPFNHEIDSFFNRTLVYAEHIRQWDFFPLWSVADNGGLGSPQPVLYHKLFYYLSGSMLLVTGGLKASVLISVWVFLVIGGVGAYSLFRAVDCTRFTSRAGAVVFLVSNYTVTNWLVRGAMAEFSAAMLVPATLAVYLRFLDADSRTWRLSFSFGVLVSLVFLAHSVLAFYTGLLVAFVTAFLVCTKAVRVDRGFLRSAVISLAGFAVIVLPVLILMSVMGARYSMESILPDNYLPVNNFWPLMNYVWDARWQWGETWEGYTVQLDLVVLVLLAVALIGVLAQRVLARPAPRETGRDFFALKILPLSLIAVLSLVLQSTGSAVFYKNFPGAGYIQFPWRLLAIITPVLIALALALLDRARGPKSIVVAFVVLNILASGFWKPIRYDEMEPVDGLGGLQFSAFGEYVPVAAREGRWTSSSISEHVNASGCDFNVVRPDPNEILSTRYLLRCDTDAVVPLPHYDSGQHTVSVHDRRSGERISWSRCAASSDFPGLCALRVTAGDYRVDLHHPTVGRLIKAGRL